MASPAMKRGLAPLARSGLHQMLWEHLITSQPVSEWRPVWAVPSLVLAVPFLLTGLALVGSRRWQWIDGLVLLVVGWQAASHLRHGVLLGIAALVLLPGPLTEALRAVFPQLTQRWAGSQQRSWRLAAVVWADGGVPLPSVRT